MSKRLPGYIDPLRLADKGERLTGEVPVSGMERLKGALVSGEGLVQVDLQFGVDEGGIHYMEGRVCAEVRMLCQRCLQPMPVRLDVSVAVGLIRSHAEVEQLPAPYEPLVTEGNESVPLADLVEDELILALPPVALHQDMAACQAPELAPAPQEETSARRNPFSVLAELKTKH